MKSEIERWALHLPHDDFPIAYAFASEMAFFTPWPCVGVRYALSLRRFSHESIYKIEHGARAVVYSYNRRKHQAELGFGRVDRLQGHHAAI